MTDILLSSANTANHYNELINELTSPINSSFEDTTTTAYPAAYSNTFQAIGFMSGYQYYEQQQQRPRSPESISSLSSSPTTPPIVSNQVALANRVMDTEIMTPVVSSTTDRVKQMITRANSVPMEFYHTEFLEYSKETYEKKTRSKRKRSPTSNTTASTTQYSYPNKRNKVDSLSDQDFEEDDYQDTMLDTMSSAEIRRQIHIQSEQKRRAQIKDGFDELRKHLPGCNNKKMSKASLLSRTVQQLQHLKGVQSELLSEVERLLQENESLKKFQQNLIQRQAMEKMYTF